MDTSTILKPRVKRGLFLSTYVMSKNSNAQNEKHCLGGCGDTDSVTELGRHTSAC
jgi:hypothetical protein